MQPLPDTNKGRSIALATQSLLDVALPVNWFVRRHMRGLRQGLSVPQFRALVFVDTQPDKSLSDMADFVGSSIPAASRLISGLVRRNLVRRQGCTHDRRQISLALTCRGQSVLRTAWTGIQQRVAQELGELSPAQCQLIVSAMEVLRGVFGEVGFRRFDACAEAAAASGKNGNGAGSTKSARRGRGALNGARQLDGAVAGTN